MTQLMIKSNKLPEVKYLITEAIEREKNIIQLAIEKTNEIIKNFEKKYKIKTERFSKMFNDGKIGDRQDYIEWAAEIKILKKLQKNYTYIGEICFASR